MAEEILKAVALMRKHQDEFVEQMRKIGASEECINYYLKSRAIK